MFENGKRAGLKTTASVGAVAACTSDMVDIVRGDYRRQ